MTAHFLRFHLEPNIAMGRLGLWISITSFREVNRTIPIKGISLCACSAIALRIKILGCSSPPCRGVRPFDTAKSVVDTAT